MMTTVTTPKAVPHENIKHNHHSRTRKAKWGACSDGYKWFVKNHPHPDGVEFADLYCELIDEKRQSDANWLIDKLFSELIGSDKAEQVVKIAKKVLQTTGESAHAATNGNWAHAATTGESAIAIVSSIKGRAKAQSGAIMLAEYDADCKLIGVAAAMVGVHGVEPDVWYELRWCHRALR